MRITENSSDLSSGRRPVSKSDEFLVILIVLPEIMRCEHGTFPIHGHTYWDFESRPFMEVAVLWAISEFGLCD